MIPIESNKLFISLRAKHLCVHVTANPDNNNTKVFIKGKCHGDIISTPIGGYSQPIAGVGPTALCAYAQNNAKNIITSDAKNKHTACSTVILTILVCDPPFTDSSIPSKSQYIRAAAKPNKAIKQ